jgi:uncharacterized protein YukE
VTDFAVDTGDLGALAQVFGAASSDAAGIAAAFRSGAGGLTGGDALGRPEVVTQYQQAFDQWAHNLDEIAASMEKLSRALALARNLYEVTERDATPKTK